MLQLFVAAVFDGLWGSRLARFNQSIQLYLIVNQFAGNKQYNKIAIQYNTIQYDIIQYNATQYNAIQLKET